MSRLGHAIAGMIWGIFIGGGIGLGVCTLILDQTLFFTGDTVLFGAIICGLCGLIFGDRFLLWIEDQWETWNGN
jgi:ABC-type nitrate/sulfonate/bicarbonate transport system permease component